MIDLYSKPNCVACDQAKAVLKAAGLKFNVVNLDVGQPKSEAEKYISRDSLLELFPGARMMPQLMVHGERWTGSLFELKNLSTSQ